MMLTVEDGVNGTGGWSGVGVGGGRGVQHLDDDGNGVCVGGGRRGARGSMEK